MATNEELRDERRREALAYLVDLAKKTVDPDLHYLVDEQAQILRVALDRLHRFDVHAAMVAMLRDETKGPKE